MPKAIPHRVAKWVDLEYTSPQGFKRVKTQRMFEKVCIDCSEKENYTYCTSDKPH